MFNYRKSLAYEFGADTIRIAKDSIGDGMSPSWRRAKGRMVKRRARQVERQMCRSFDHTTG